MENIVNEFETKIMDNTFDNEYPQLIKCLLFKNYLNMSIKTEKLFFNYIYQNRDKLGSESHQLFDYYTRISGFYSHSLIKKDHIMDKIYYHNNMNFSEKQLELLEFISTISSKYNFISAPTSFGKTKIILETLLANYDRIIIILPSKALINEYMNNINEYMNEKNNNSLITCNPSTDFEDANNFIFVCTQERLNLSNCEEADIILIDEAQEIRSINESRTLELVVALKSLKAPFILLCPYININSLANAYKYILKDEFEYDSFTVTELDALVSKRKYYVDSFTKGVGLKYIINDKVKRRLIDQVRVTKRIDLCIAVLKGENLLKRKNIIYTGSKAKSLEYAHAVKGISKPSNLSITIKKLIKYFEEEYSPDFDIIDMLKKGVVIHTTDLDPFARKVIEYSYNREETIFNIVATSTIAAGVNLECENLLYVSGRRSEPAIETKNIMGRSGRFNKYNVGTNYYFLKITHEKIKEDSIPKLENIPDENYKEKSNTDIYDDMKRMGRIERNKIFKYYVSKEDYENLKLELERISFKRRSELFENPLIYENLVEIFKIYFYVTSPINLPIEYYAVIFIEYLSGKSLKRVLEDNFKDGIYFDPEKEYFAKTKKDGSTWKYLTLDNATKEEKNKFLFMRIRDNNKQCEFELKKVVTIILYIIMEMDQNEENVLKDLYMNFEYNVDNKANREFIQKLIDFGVDDKFLINKIKNDKELKHKIENAKNKEEIKKIIKEYYGEDSYCYLAFLIKT